MQDSRDGQKLEDLETSGGGFLDVWPRLAD
jgi:hypothetical protein